MMTVPLSDREIEDLVHSEADHARRWSNGLLSGVIAIGGSAALFVVALVDPRAAAVAWGLILTAAIVTAGYFVITWKAR